MARPSQLAVVVAHRFSAVGPFVITGCGPGAGPVPEHACGGRQ